MSASWKRCPVWALRIFHSRGIASRCSLFYHVELNVTRQARFGDSLGRFSGGDGVKSNFGVTSRYLGCSSHRYCTVIAPELELEVDVDELDLDVRLECEVPEIEREESYEFLRSLGLKDEKLTRLVKKCRNVLSRSFKIDMLSLLQTFNELEISEQLASRLLEKNPQMMVRVLERNVYTENLTYLKSRGLTPKQLERVVRIYPQSLGGSKLLQLQPTVEFLLSLGVTEEKIGKVVALSPYYLGYRHDITLLPKVAFFMSLGVKKEHLGKMIMEQPCILCLSIGENIMPKLEYLESVGVQRGRVAQMICRYPAMLTSNLDTLKLKVDFFRSKGLLGNHLINLLTLHPDLLGRSLESLNTGFANVQSVGFTQEEVCAIMKMHPTVLSSTEVNMRKKFEFLTAGMSRSLKEVLTFTAFVTYSLEKRIKPRHRVFSWLLAEGLLPQKNYSLRTIIGGSEEYFRERFLRLHPLAEAMYKGTLEAKVG